MPLNLLLEIEAFQLNSSFRFVRFNRFRFAASPVLLAGLSGELFENAPLR